MFCEITEYSKLNDAALVQLSLQGDRQAYGDLIQRHWRKCVEVACYFLRNISDAEDQAQNGLMKAYEHLDQFQGDAEFSTWLSRIVANQCRMLMRSRRRAEFVYLDDVSSPQRTVPIQLPSTEPDPEVELAYSQLTHVLRSEIRMIPVLMRNVMLLRDIEGLPLREVADRLGITVAAAKSRLVRARAELRSRMTKRHEDLRDSRLSGRGPKPVVRAGRGCLTRLAS